MTTDKKLAIIGSHPIQYYAPVFQLLAKKIELKVFYTWGESSLNKFDKGFGKQVEWDLPLLDGYQYTFLKNSSKNQGTHHFNGIDNPTLIEDISQFKPNAILIYGWAWKSHLKAIRFYKGKIPIYFRGDSTILNKRNGLKDIIKMLFLKWVYHHVDFAFYVGTSNKNYFKKYGLKESQLIFAPHAIDNHRFGIDRLNESSKLRKDLGIGEGEILILFAGKFEGVKNPKLLLQAFIELNLPNVHLLFVGNGELEEELKVKSEKLKAESLDYAQDDNNRDKNPQDENVKKRIHFMGFQNQSQIPVVYQACDLFCLPSKSETWGLAINEAMAAGKAVIASDKVGCSPDLIKPAHGAIFKSEDIEDLKQKLIALTKSKSQLKKMGQIAQQYIQIWSFEKQADIIATHVNR